MPKLPPQVEYLVVALDPELRLQSFQVAAKLRQSGRTADLVLEDKKFKWVVKYSDKVQPRKLVLMEKVDWDAGLVRLRDAIERSEVKVTVDQLVGEQSNGSSPIGEQQKEAAAVGSTQD